MRIGMLADAYKPHISGVTNYIALNKKYLEERGHEVYVFTFMYEDYQDDEKNVIRSQGLPFFNTGLYFSVNYSKEARKLLSSMDIAHVNHPFFTGSLVMAYCRPRKIPIVFTNHTRYDLYAQAYVPAMPEIVSLKALQAYLPRFCRYCDRVISPSPGMKVVLRNLGVDVRIDVIPNGVDLEPFKAEATLTRTDVGFQPDDKLLIYVGRLGPEKNLPFLLRAFAGVIQVNDRARLILLGDGPERENLEDQVENAGLKNKVRFTGLIPYDQVASYMAIADAFVSASYTEVHPLTVIEAMAAGLPVLGIASPGVSDTVIPGETGYLVEKDDLEGFRTKMIELVMNEEDRQRLGRNASVEVERYSIQNTVHLLEQLYLDVLEQAGRREHGFKPWITQKLEKLRI